MICRRARLRAGPGEYGSSFVGGGESWSVRGVCGADTLLGPEGSGPFLLRRPLCGGGGVGVGLVASGCPGPRVRPDPRLSPSWWWVCAGGRVCPGWAWSYVENCTVDASIFVALSF